MTSIDIEAASPFRTEGLNDGELRALVVATLDREPDASFDIVHAHLRSMEGRTLTSAETERLRDAYQSELAHPTGAHRIGAVEAAEIVANQPFALRRTEIAGLVAGVIPFVFHLQTTTPATVTKATGAVVAGGVYDLVAMTGGFIAVVLGLSALRQAAHTSTRRAMHLALAGLVLLLGVYQSLLGLGILHQIGVFSAS
jgi:hypothetical protein